MDTHGFSSEAPVSPGHRVKIVTDDAFGVHEFVTHLSAFAAATIYRSAIHVSFLVHASPCAMLISSCLLHPTLRTSRVKLCICLLPRHPSSLLNIYHLWHHWDSPRHSTALRVFRPSPAVAGYSSHDMVRATHHNTTAVAWPRRVPCKCCLRLPRPQVLLRAP
jgi:hypothetical protein